MKRVYVSYMVGIRIPQTVREIGPYGARGVEIKRVEIPCITPLAL